jgi:rRNA maturation endonuclease Nob1
MDSTLEPDDIKRVKLHSVKCPKCKANLMVKLTEKVCPVCGGLLPKHGKR